ncbi:hypothetical protein CDAR_440721 [Caerostris darwini]|uniref:Uncharacterized protein n=1 Tax=Caerostris darwini TaxID=1538125 RepID=A0AAV4MMI6_9ARAC|nr:hypothetical protein CDAR_440721 [Caerostris darwini]
MTHKSPNYPIRRAKTYKTGDKLRNKKLQLIPRQFVCDAFNAVPVSATSGKSERVLVLQQLAYDIDKLSLISGIAGVGSERVEDSSNFHMPIEGFFLPTLISILSTLERLF